MAKHLEVRVFPLDVQHVLLCLFSEDSYRATLSLGNDVYVLLAANHAGLRMKVVGSVDWRQVDRRAGEALATELRYCAQFVEQLRRGQAPFRGERAQRHAILRAGVPAPLDCDALESREAHDPGDEDDGQTAMFPE